MRSTSGHVGMQLLKTGCDKISILKQHKICICTSSIWYHRFRFSRCFYSVYHSFNWIHSLEPITESASQGIGEEVGHGGTSPMWPGLSCSIQCTMAKLDGGEMLLTLELDTNRWAFKNVWTFSTMHIWFCANGGMEVAGVGMYSVTKLQSLWENNSFPKVMFWQAVLMSPLLGVVYTWGQQQMMS